MDHWTGVGEEKWKWSVRHCRRDGVRGGCREEKGLMRSWLYVGFVQVKVVWIGLSIMVRIGVFGALKKHGTLGLVHVHSD